MKVYDLVCILSAMPDEHELYINGSAIEEIRLNMNREVVNLTLRGENKYKDNKVEVQLKTN